VDAAELAAGIDSRLRGVGDATRADNEKRYLKSVLQHYGVTVPAIRRIARDAVAEQPALRREDLVRLVEDLWSRPVHETRMAAVELLELRSGLLRTDDLVLVERLSANVAGGLVERFPGLGTMLDRWAIDEDFWLRRSALLALLKPLRRGDGDFARFGRLADAMLDEREFFIRKAIGWVLREASKSRPERVFAWLEPRASRASGVTLREAVKYLSEDQRAAILAGRSSGTRAQAPP
jgi:3-methyladenine DNA glycosylase AlkD